jgi:hypothetical protein
LAIYLILTEGGLWACIVVSFLPFIRSEGLLMVGVFSLYFLIKRQWKYIPLLSIGHIFYGIVGRYYNGSFWWIFTKMTYATTNAYGSGSILHFFDRLYYMTGLPNFILWVIGVLSFLFLIKKKVNTPQFSVHFLLVYGSFWALFIAHTLFWYFGIFMSYGLGRVLNAVMPMFAIIALDGFNFILYFIKNINIRIWISRALVAYLLFFPFTKHPAAINASTSLRLEADQKTAIEIARFIKEKYPDYVVYVLHPQVMHSLGYDNFDRTKVMDIREALNAPLSKKSLIVWDSRFCIIDAGVVVEDVIKVPQLIEIQRFKTANNFEFVLYINSIQ